MRFLRLLLQPQLPPILRTIGRSAAYGWHAAIDLLLPPRCAFCGSDLDEPLTTTPAPRFALCPTCVATLAPATWCQCARCGGQTAAPVPDCPWCREHRLQFDAAFPLGPYEKALRQAVLRMKRPSGEGLARAMAGLLVQRRGEELRAFRPDLILPVPMFWRRRLWRGINSPRILARDLSLHLGVLCRFRLLVRVHNTKSQKDLRPKERFRNVAHAFSLRPGYALRGARVLVVDDILTTGATASALAGVLKQAGVAAVALAVLARAEGREPPADA